MNLLVVPALWSHEPGAADRDREFLAPWFVLISLTQIGNLILSARTGAPPHSRWLRAYVWPANLMVAFTAWLWYRTASDPVGTHAPWFWSLYSAMIAASGLLILRLTGRPRSAA